jgi:hypothetical protein
MTKRVYKGYIIFDGPEGYHWSHGGYFDTVAEARDDIDYWTMALLGSEPDETPDDTPSLVDIMQIEK